MVDGIQRVLGQLSGGANAPAEQVALSRAPSDTIAYQSPGTSGFEADAFGVVGPGAVAANGPKDRVKMSGTLKGPRGAIKQVEGELRKVAFMRDDIDVEIQVFDEGGWLRPRVIGFALTGPRHLVEQIRDQLDAYVKSNS